MQITSAWVKPPLQIGGLDHLAVQAPCINIYSRLIPGITNVTDRARYYSFYPWLIWAFDQAGIRDFDEEFIELFRRADCLFTLIAERYERRSLIVTSNVVFSQWDQIFQSPMATAAAIDRIVHHSVILEFDVPSYRTDQAKRKSQKALKDKKEEKTNRQK